MSNKTPQAGAIKACAIRAIASKAMAIIALSLAVVGVTAPQGAHAEFGVRVNPDDPTRADFASRLVMTDHTTPYTQGGGHDFELTTRFAFNVTPSGEPDGRVRNIEVNLPAGVVADPAGTPQCPVDDLRNNSNCIPETQVGVLNLNVWLGASFPFPPIGVYNLEPAPGDVMTLGFNAANVSVTIHVRLRVEGDYGGKALIAHTSELLPLLDTSLTLWGVPADTAHDTLRSCAPQESPSGAPCPSRTPIKPFLTNGTDCGSAPGETSLTVDDWPLGAHQLSYRDTAGSVLTGCDKLKFEPAFTFGPSVSRAGVPSGYHLHLHIPKNMATQGVGTPPVRRAVLRLPKGVRISPSAAQGLAGCSDDEIGLRVDGAAKCPPASKIGTVKITTPLLDQPLEGAVYQGSQTPEKLFRLFLEAEGGGARVKLGGSIDVDATSGQITSTFDDTPQLPFSDLELQFKGGPRAPLVNPSTCGTYTTVSELTPWSAPVTPVAVGSASFAISSDSKGAPCAEALRFSPRFEAGSGNPVAGATTGFLLSVSRDDDEQELGAVSVRLPRGLTGRISDVPLCLSADASAGVCDVMSRIGSVLTGAGAGPTPLLVAGDVYLTGPYRGAPFGLSIVVRAVAGPFDLGRVVVRAAVFVDRYTAQLRVVSDPLPVILLGVPLQLREVNVAIDKENFVLNPTSCAEKRVAGTLVSTEGATVGVGNRFQVGECDRLGLDPRIHLRSGGRKHTSRGASTSLTTSLTVPQGMYANLKAVDVTLPLALNARLPIVNKACTPQEFEAEECEQARAGSALAVTPILKHALRGGVFFVKDDSKPAGSLPKLVVALRGEVDVDLIGRIEISNGQRLATHFTTVPDVPVKKFVLRLVAGPKGPLGVAQNLCSARARLQRVEVVFRGQNGAIRKVRPRLDVAGCARR